MHRRRQVPKRVVEASASVRRHRLLTHIVRHVGILPITPGDITLESISHSSRAHLMFNLDGEIGVLVPMGCVWQDGARVHGSEGSRSQQPPHGEPPPPQTQVRMALAEHAVLQPRWRLGGPPSRKGLWPACAARYDSVSSVSSVSRPCHQGHLKCPEKSISP